MRNYVITEVVPKVFVVYFDCQYDLGMTFWRCQEWMENVKFRKKQFDLITFMEWYVYEYNGSSFTYSGDNDGYNIPIKIIQQVKDQGIKDKNIYDDEILKIAKKLKCPDGYLIGSYHGIPDSLHHEVAHGLYYTNKDYRLAMKKLVLKLPKKIQTRCQLDLKMLGYHKAVWTDELHAYMTTDTLSFMFKNIMKWRQPFRNIFAEYTKDVNWEKIRQGNFARKLRR